MLLHAQAPATGETVTVNILGDGQQTYATTNNPYYTIANITGNVLTLKTGETLTAETGVFDSSLAPVSITAGTIAAQSVTFGNTGTGSSEAGTITLADNGNWEGLGYTVGGGIYVQGTGTNGNGNTFRCDPAQRLLHHRRNQRVEPLRWSKCQQATERPRRHRRPSTSLRSPSRCRRRHRSAA